MNCGCFTQVKPAGVCKSVETGPEPNAGYEIGASGAAADFGNVP